MGKHAKETEEPLRILQLNSGSRNFGGVSSFLFQVYRHIDRDKVQFDFLSPEETTYGIVRDRIREMGGNIIELGIRGNVLARKVKLFTALTGYLRRHPYRIVHINSGNFFFNITAAAAARKAGVPVRIVHSHNAGSAGMSLPRRVMFRLLKPNLERSATHLAACSHKAAEYMFTAGSVSRGRVRIIKNGIETETFAFDPGVRAAVRKEAGIEDRLVIGHIGRFMRQKNHEFLLEIFGEILKMRKDAVLLLLGEGELMDSIRKKAREMGIDESVRFLGQRPDACRWYQAMDVFVMPIFHEGLPVSGVEAQAAGLPVLISDTVTEEIRILDGVEFLPLSAPASVWAENAVRMASGTRRDGSGAVARAGYSIGETAGELQRFYLAAAGNPAGEGK